MANDVGPVVKAERCQGCSNCVMACPINQKLDKGIIDGESPKSDNVVLRVKNGFCTVLNKKLCLQKNFECKRCEEICPRGAIQVQSGKFLNILQQTCIEQDSRKEEG